MGRTTLHYTIAAVAVVISVSVVVIISDWSAVPVTLPAGRDVAPIQERKITAQQVKNGPAHATQND